MKDRERLARILDDSPYLDVMDDEHWLLAAEHLISKGVTIQHKAKWVTEHGNTTCSLCHCPAPVFTSRLPFGSIVIRSKRTQFCPRCGAKMIGE